ncbi:MAG: hypothetical protein FJ222_11155 [Lentisphaerae bacterium]|nr:hypothetical protein [Lentisphaerota bacterium]
MLAPRWTKFMRVGPWLRGERDKRYYLNMFSNAGMIGGLGREALLRLLPGVEEGASTVASEGRRSVIWFRGMEQFFNPFLSEQPLIAERLRAITNPAIVRRVDEAAGVSSIGVHIRRGDFKCGGHTIPDAWYLRAIGAARERLPGVPVRVFSDASPAELAFLKGVENLRVMPSAPALHDLLLLSRSSLVVGTSWSTFSMWAVFLGQMPSLWHPRVPPPDLMLPGTETPLLLADVNNG